MKTKNLFAVLVILFGSLLASTSRATDITATNSGNWSDPTIWNSGTVPGTNDDADIPQGINVTVDTNVSVQFIYDPGTVTMAPNTTLTILGDQAIDKLTTLVATATGNTVIYVANPFFARQCNYYNLVFANTNYVDPFPPFSPYQNFNNFSSSQGPTPMTIAGNMTIIGATKVQQGSGGAPITIGGNLIIGTNCLWDSSGDNLTVMGDVFVGGLLEDLNGALGSNYFGGNVTVSAGAAGGWNVSDVIQWGIGGNLTNNGPIFGKGYGSITFNGSGIITGKPLKIPTMTVNGTYNIGTTITLTTNTPTLNGTLVFDLATTNQLILQSSPTNPLTLFYSGNLNVIKSGPAPASGSTYKLFGATNYDGAFTSTSLPSLPSGLTWVNNLLTTGSITVSGAAISSPVLSLSRSGGTLTLSWDSGTFPGYSVQGQTNSTGLTTNWGPTSSGTVSPFTININPNNPSVFFRLSHP